MFGQIPIDIKKIDTKDIDKEILRISIIAELDAINVYEQFASQTTDENLRKILLDVAKEEKTHVGEFQRLLLNRDKEQVQELEAGKEEVKEETGE